ncbi:MAG: hypothetical protein Q9175_002448 [Cornicularia normoerica]
MVIVGQRTPDTYGRLRGWEEDDAVYAMLTNGFEMSPGEGSLVLEIQQRSMRFLVRCTELVLTIRNWRAWDHLWSLREDPAHLRDTVREASEHRKEAISTREGFCDPLPQTQSFWGSVLGGIVSDAYEDFMLWDLIWKDFKALATLRDRYGARVSPGRSLPQDFEDAHRHFSL